MGSEKQHKYLGVQEASANNLSSQQPKRFVKDVMGHFSSMERGATEDVFLPKNIKAFRHRLQAIVKEHPEAAHESPERALIRYGFDQLHPEDIRDILLSVMSYKEWREIDLMDPKYKKEFWYPFVDQFMHRLNATYEGRHNYFLQRAFLIPSEEFVPIEERHPVKVTNVVPEVVMEQLRHAKVEEEFFTQKNDVSMAAPEVGEILTERAILLKQVARYVNKVGLNSHDWPQKTSEVINNTYTGWPLEVRGKLTFNRDNLRRIYDVLDLKEGLRGVQHHDWHKPWIRLGALMYPKDSYFTTLLEATDSPTRLIRSLRSFRPYVTGEKAALSMEKQWREFQNDATAQSQFAFMGMDLNLVLHYLRTQESRTAKYLLGDVRASAVQKLVEAILKKTK